VELEIKGLPIDVSRLLGRVVMVAPRPRVNGEGELRPDRDGQTVFLVGVAVVKDASNEASVIDVQITSELVGIEVGSTVELDGLEATPWNFEGRSGLSWKASSIKALSPGVDKPGLVVEGPAVKPAGVPGQRKAGDA
jgi:hypothetical protein